MWTRISTCWQTALVLVPLYAPSVALSNPLQLVSVAETAIVPPASGGGDSVAPILSSDGRYILFTSTANNLALTTSNTPLRTPFPPRLNVFLRDRTNGTTTLVSAIASGSSGGNGDSLASDVSTNGRYVLFESSASDLVPDDTNACNDVFIRDLVAGTTRLVSVATNGGVANGDSWGPVMTCDGRYVAFVCQADNLVPGDTNRIADVFVKDLHANTVTLVSTGAMYTHLAAASCSSETPDITPDGRYVAFYSTATNLVPGVRTVGDIYVRDLAAGITHCASTNARALLQAVTGRTNAVSSSHTISGDGKYVAFETSSTGDSALPAGIVLRYNLETGFTDIVNTNARVAGTPPCDDFRSLDMTPDGRFIAFVANTNGTSGATTCICVWDAQTGETVLASGDLSNSVPTGSICDWPTIDPTGRLVAFLSLGTNLVTNALTGGYHLYVRDLQAGSTVLVNANSNRLGCGVSFAAPSRLSADGRFIAFQAPDGNLVPADRNHSEDVFLRDLVAGATELVSARQPTLPSLSPNGSGGSPSLSVSTDGRYVAFASDADNVVLNDTNGRRDVFVRDLQAGLNYLVSVSTNGMAPGNEPATEHCISANGRYVAFSSSANNLVAGDANKAQDVFVRDLLTGTTTLASVNTNHSGPGRGESYTPVISADGQRILFRSLANDLAPGVSGSRENLFYRDLPTGVTRALTASPGVYSASMTPDGRLVAFVGTIGGSTPTPYLYVWDSQSATRVYTNTAPGLARVAISPDGNRLAYATTSHLYAAEWAVNTNWLVGAISPSSHVGMRFNADGRFLTYASTTAQALVDTNETYDVYLYDLQTRAKLLVSQASGFAGAAEAASDSPDISADGRFVAYRSAAGNIVAGDTNGVADVFIYDQLTRTTTLLSMSRFGNCSADNWCLPPVFTGDGRQLVFQSWASDLVGFDFNHSSDVFAYAMFCATIVPGDMPVHGPTLSWPAVTGKAYRVQFLDDLSGSNWQDAEGSVTVVGDRADFSDPAPPAAQRFYRILAN